MLYPKRPQPIENVPKTKPKVLNMKLYWKYNQAQTKLFRSFDGQRFQRVSDHDLKYRNDRNQLNDCQITSFLYWRIWRIWLTVLNFLSWPFRFIVPLCAHLQIFFTSNKPFLTKSVLKDHQSLFECVFPFICSC